MGTTQKCLLYIPYRLLWRETNSKSKFFVLFLFFANDAIRTENMEVLSS